MLWSLGMEIFFLWSWVDGDYIKYVTGGGDILGLSYGTFILIDAINDKKYLKGGDDAFELFINGYNGITVNNNITNHNSDKILFNFDGNSMNIDKNSFIITHFNAKKISENDNENENNNNVN
eukprot:120606_1